jgi:hypothetical protein
MILFLFPAAADGGSDGFTEPDRTSQDRTEPADSIRLSEEVIEIPVIEKRSPTGALLRSAVLPGWGQFYNDRPVKGLVLGSIELGLLGWLISEHIASEDARRAEDDQSYQLHSQRRLDLIWYTSAAWLFGMMDAYVDAYLYSFSAENDVFERETGIGMAIYVDL